jgi:phage-related protein
MEAGEQRKEQENDPRPERSGQRVKRVALPSGKTIEVVYFEEGTRHEEPAQLDLHLCPDCDAGLVYPVHWTEVDRANWEVTLRCPNCEWLHTGVFDQETVERFDEQLDRGTDSLVDDLKRLVHANMEEDIERFAHALARDFILPEDF